MDITEDVWNDVKDIVEKSNLHSSDAMHLALAQALGCRILFTHDRFFIEEGNRILKDAKEYDSLKICDVDEVEERMKDGGPHKI